MKKQIKLVVAAFAIMLVGVTSAFAKSGRVAADDFGVIPGVYECSKIKYEFYVGTSGYICWEDEYGDYGNVEWLGVGDVMTIRDKYLNRYTFETVKNDRTKLKDGDDAIFKLTKPAKGSDLLMAIFEGRSNRYLFKMIDDGANVNYRACGTTALHEAARTGNFPLAKKLKGEKDEEQKLDKNSKFPEDIAKENGYTELAKYLEGPYSFKSPDPTDLIEAAEAGALDAVKRQVSLGADINGTAILGSKGPWSALAIAASEGHKDVVRYLLDMGCDIEKQAPDSKGVGCGTALYYAARSGKLDCVKLLVDYGADVNAKAKSTGKRPLQRAEDNKKTEVVNYLKSKGAY